MLNFTRVLDSAEVRLQAKTLRLNRSKIHAITAIVPTPVRVIRIAGRLDGNYLDKSVIT